MSWLKKLLQESVSNVGHAVEGGINKAAVASAGPDYNNWVHDLAVDYKKRGPIEFAHDLTNPIINNPRIQPYAEPIISDARVNVSRMKPDWLGSPLKRILGLPQEQNVQKYGQSPPMNPDDIYNSYLGRY